MNNYRRIFIALFLLLSGFMLVPQTSLVAGVVTWQRFAGGYEDNVTITLARYVTSFEGGGNLEVHATNTAGGNATLMVYRTSDNFFIGNLTYTGTDHRGTFTLASNPNMITVRSSLGGPDATASTPEIPAAVEVATLNAGDDRSMGFAILGIAALTGVLVFAAMQRRR
jgi:hypothetical protein